MICPNCYPEMCIEMYIETWEGWIWKCPMCDHYGRIATQEESDLQEKEHAEYLKGLLQNKQLI